MNVFNFFYCRDKEEKKKAILEQHVNMTQKQEEMRVIDGKKVKVRQNKTRTI